VRPTLLIISVHCFFSPSQVHKELGPAPRPPAAPKGLYLHGSVGSGKTLLMVRASGPCAPVYVLSDVKAVLACTSVFVCACVPGAELERSL
jgi:hypothetical protein